MLSNVDIKKALKHDISIYPFPKIEGASFDLTASKYAWLLSTKKRVKFKSEKKINEKFSKYLLTIH